MTGLTTPGSLLACRRSGQANQPGRAWRVRARAGRDARGIGEEIPRKRTPGPWHVNQACSSQGVTVPVPLLRRTARLRCAARGKGEPAARTTEDRLV